MSPRLILLFNIRLFIRVPLPYYTIFFNFCILFPRWKFGIVQETMIQMAAVPEFLSVSENSCLHSHLNSFASNIKTAMICVQGQVMLFSLPQIWKLIPLKPQRQKERHLDLETYSSSEDSDDKSSSEDSCAGMLLRSKAPDAAPLPPLSASSNN